MHISHTFSGNTFEIKAKPGRESRKVITPENCLLKSNADKLLGGCLCQALLEFIDFGLCMGVR